MVNLKDIFGFSDQDAVREIDRKLGITQKIKDSFKYLITRMKPQKLVADLSKLKWEDGKNYDWVYITIGDVDMIIRKYQSHFTIYTRLVKKLRPDGLEYSYPQKIYSAFEFSTDREKLTDKESDKRCDDKFLDINNHISRIIEKVKSDSVHWFGNSVSYPREDYINIKSIYTGETIYTIDKLLFACDEICEKYFEHYSKNETYETLSLFKEGDVFGKEFHGDAIVTGILTKIKNNDWHHVGLHIKSGNGEEHFRDVFYLTRWELEKINGKILENQFDKLT